jgi:formate hydrogenlyase transcriptional activator
MATARRVDQPKRKTRTAAERTGRKSNRADALTAAPLGEFKDNFREFLDRALGPAWTANADGGRQLVNRRWVEYTGDLAEGGEGSWRALHPDDSQRMPDTWTALRRAEGPGDFEARLKRIDGVFRWFLFHAEPHRGPDGALVGWYGTATDIEDRKRTQSLHAAEMRTLQMITDGASLTDILTQLCVAIDCQIAPSKTTILLLDPDGKWLWPAAGPKISPDWMRAITPLPVVEGFGPCATATCLKRTVIVEDVATDPIWPEDFRELAIKSGIRAGWSQPILTKEQHVLGTFAVYSTEPKVPTDTDLALAESASHIALLAIQRQRSHEALTRALDDIRKSEEDLRRTTDAIAQAIIVLDPDGRAIYANRVALEYTGLSLEEVRDEGFRKRVFHPDDVERLRAGRESAFAGTVPYENEQRARGRDGQYRWFLIQYNPLLDDSGRPIRWYATGTDIEDRKRSENKLRQDERELRQLIDFLPQHVLVLDGDGSVLQANQTLLDYRGSTLEEIQGGPVGGWLRAGTHPDDVERVQTERRAAVAAGVPFELEQRLLARDGQYRWFLFRGKPVVDDAGRIVRWFATATDIEDRKRAEDRMRNETVVLREDLVRSSMFEEIVGSAPPLRRVLAQVERVASTDSTVLILGETGTGKELIARAIHARSKRSNRAFVCVNCAALPQSLITSELFGHEKGAFTGAIHRRVGRFESAEGGTLFLDEIAELSLETQVALLRVLQEREFNRVGAQRPIAIDVRVLAASNRDLHAAIAEGTFRADLFYRLNVFPIHLPALRDRSGDIPLLVEYLVERYAQKAGKKFRRISRETLELFRGYSWPGNVRELQNVIERAVILCDGDTFSVEASWLCTASPKASVRGATLPADIADRERAMIEKALREASGRIAGPKGAAAVLGIPRQTLESKMKKLGLVPYLFKQAARD